MIDLHHFDRFSCQRMRVRTARLSTISMHQIRWRWLRVQLYAGISTSTK